MMHSRRKTDSDSPVVRTGFAEELEKWKRRARALPLAAPILLLAGFGVGNLTNRALELPAGTPVRAPSANHVPRVRIDALSRMMSKLQKDGTKTVSYVTTYKNDVAPVEQVLRRRGVSRTTARKVAWPLVENANKHNMEPATLVSIMLMESDGIPSARSSVGARGLMQVMPFWAGKWRGCGSDLYDIEDNLCNGSNILAMYMRDKGDERKALLGYNGCVNGTNTPGCHSYPDKFTRLKTQVTREINAAKSKPSIQQ
ncbi:MAG: lytic transglycosylase domain-containing protein [Longimicrobiales bacterium]